MITARHTWSGRAVCRLFSGYYLNQAFKDIRIIGPRVRQKGAILMIGNHFSWWDGFIQYLLNEQVYKRKFHVMMLEEQLLQNKILNKGGAYSVKKQSRDVIKSLTYTLDLLKDPSNMVLLFPQGRIESLHQDTLRFEAGIHYIMERLPKDVQLVFNVNLIDYHAEKKPTLYVYHQSMIWYHWKGDMKVEKKYNEFYQLCRKRQQKLWT